MFRKYLIFVLLLGCLVPEICVAGNPNIITRQYPVSGVCDQCKKRIEEAAYIRGVKFAEWNVDKNELTIKYDSTRASSAQILQSIADAGHDAGDIKATDAAYNSLPACCRYRSGLKKHAQ